MSLQQPVHTTNLRVVILVKSRPMRFTNSAICFCFFTFIVFKNGCHIFLFHCLEEIFYLLPNPSKNDTRDPVRHVWKRAKAEGEKKVFPRHFYIYSILHIQANLLLWYISPLQDHFMSSPNHYLRCNIGSFYLRNLMIKLVKQKFQLHTIRQW